MSSLVRTIAMLGATAMLMACGKAAIEGDSALQTAAANTGKTSMPGQNVIDSQDGIPIAYASYGEGTTTAVLIHGWSCNQAYWREQITPLSEAGFRVVTLDLAGHGASGTGRAAWTVSGYGDDVQAVVESLGIERAVLVGHSMGGLVALQAASQLNGIAVGVIAVDSLHDAELSYDPAQSEAMIQPFKADFNANLANMFTFMTGPAAEPSLTKWIIKQGTQSDPDAAIGLLYDYAQLDSPAMFRAAGVPVRAINAAASPSQPPTMTERNRQYADFDATLVDGVGHFLQLEAPDRVNPVLIDYLNTFK